MLQWWRDIHKVHVVLTQQKNMFVCDDTVVAVCF